MTTKNQIIIYLLKDKFQLYAPTLPTLLEFNFVPKVVRDLDIIDHKFLEELLLVFLTTNPIPQGEVLIVIGENASFVKDFVGTDQEALQKQAKEFIQHVPFESVAGTTFVLSNGLRAYATNKDLYDTIIKTFEKKTLIVTAVFPGIAFGDAVDGKKTLDAQMITTVLQQMNIMQEYNLIGNRPIPTARKISPPQSDSSLLVEAPEEVSPKQTNKDRLLMLLLVFGVLIIVLVVLIIVNQPF